MKYWAFLVLGKNVFTMPSRKCANFTGLWPLEYRLSFYLLVDIVLVGWTKIRARIWKVFEPVITCSTGAIVMSIAGIHTARETSSVKI